VTRYHPKGSLAWDKRTMSARSTKRKSAIPSRGAPRPIRKAGGLLYEVEEVMGVRMGTNGVEYLVKWDGYPSSDNEWIDELPPFFHKGSDTYKKEAAATTCKKSPVDKDYRPEESGSDSDDEINEDEINDDEIDDDEINDDEIDDDEINDDEIDDDEIDDDEINDDEAEKALAEKALAEKAKKAYDAQPDVPKRLSHGPCPGCIPGMLPPKKRPQRNWFKFKKHRTVDADTESD
jgi:hypothetical protein